MSDIFREVDEELRQEKLQALWKSYGSYLIAGLAIFVAVVAGYRFYQSWQASQAGASGAKYATALELISTGNAQDARPILTELADEGHGAYPMLARLETAAALSETGNRDDAVSLYDSIAADNSVDATFQNLARIRAGLLLVDTASPEEISDRVGGLATDDSIWRHSAREIIALSQYRAGDFENADTTFDRIMADPAAPARLKSRAEIMRTLIAPNLVAEGS